MNEPIREFLDKIENTPKLYEEEKGSAPFSLFTTHTVRMEGSDEND